MNYKNSIARIQEEIEEKLNLNFGVTLDNANDDQYYKAVASGSNTVVVNAGD